MSDERKNWIGLSESTAGTLVENMSDGTTRYRGYDRAYPAIQARWALQVVGAVVASEMLRQAMSEEGSAIPSPKKIASYACDIAQQLINQCCEREWMLFIADPHPTPATAEEVR